MAVIRTATREASLLRLRPNSREHHRLSVNCRLFCYSGIKFDQVCYHPRDCKIHRSAMTYMPNRRSFLITGGLTALAATRAFGSNDRLRIGVIGAGGRMRQLLNAAENSGVPFEIVSVCDVYTPRREEVKTRPSATAATTCVDYSNVLDDKS